MWYPVNVGFAACVVWLVLLFKDVRSDASKAFEKYRIPSERNE